jgi:hypothetical protein
VAGKISAAIKRGWQPQWSKAVIVMVNRRPSADTPITRSVEAAMQELKKISAS